MRYFFLTFFFSATVFSQSFSLSGFINSSEGKPLPGTNVFIEKVGLGSVADSQGFYIFKNLPKGYYTVKASYVGFGNISKEIDLTKNSKLDFILKSQDILLGESIVKAETGKTPYSFSNLTYELINEKIGSQEAVYGLQSIPNIFISPQGGGVGDLRLSIRGFSQTNIGVMIDGVPVNNPENGEVYWTNWAGMSDIISGVQVQRGLGFVPYSISSVGGNINFISMENTGSEFVKFKTEFGSDNFRKNSISFSQRISDNFSLTSLISKKTWDGYADKTKLDEITYFFALNGNIANHFLKINLYGSPQTHGQRLTMQTINFWKSHGSKFNSDWGYLNGKPLNLRDNVFHKPTVSLNHQWRLSDNFIQTNTFYYSYGEGGGTVPPWAEFKKNSSGLIDFDSEFSFNSNNIDTNFHPSLHYTKNALRFTVHKHYWSGLISSIQYKSEYLFLIVGFDFKYYSAENYRKVDNLLGGDYTIGSSNINKPANALLFVGDKVDYNADSFTRQGGLFLNTEYNSGNFTDYLNISFSNTSYKRIDFFNYKNDDPKRETKWKSILSYTIKTGLNYDLGKANIYFNIGYFTKPPLSENVFDYSNNLYQNIINEKILNAELGFNYLTSVSDFKLNLFRTFWKDKAFSQTIQDQNTGQLFFTNISGGSAIHTGIEIEAKQILTENIFINSSFAISNNRWTDNINAVLSPESDPTQKSKVQSFIKNTFVGGFPMTNAIAEANYHFSPSVNSEFFINPVFNFYGNHYAQFNPNFRNQTNKKAVNSWRLPDYFLVDLHFGYKVKSDGFVKGIEISFNLFNILNKKDYVIDAYDGLNHDSKSAIVWFGRERWWHVSTGFYF
jgi:hypothetical protein